MPYVSNWEEVVHAFRRDVGKLSKKVKLEQTVLTPQAMADLANETCPGTSFLGKTEMNLSL